MRMLLRVKFPHAKFNAAIKDGTASVKMQKILAEIKPEAAYFTEFDGHRCAILIVDLTDLSHIPALAEPWFLTFEADVELHPAMVADDLAHAHLDAMGKKWG